MRIATPQLEVLSDTVRLLVAAELGGEARTWWIEAPLGYGPQLDVGSTPFVPAATLLAAASGEDLEFDAAVSSMQLEGARRAAEMYADWWGWRVPTITAPTSEPAHSKGNEAGLLFTRGIDSTASAITALERGEPDVTLLIGIDGLEPRHTPAVAAAVMADTAEAAAVAGLPFVRLATNLRTETDRFTAWGAHAHGAVLLGCALALGPVLRRITISPTVKEPTDLRHGSTPTLDACWATERTAICTADVALDRVDRAAIVGTRPELARRIKVCWEGDQRGNCGRCSKCLHTMTALAITGSPAVIPDAFDAPLTAEAVRAAQIAPAQALQDVVARIGPDHAEMRAAWEDLLNRSAWGDRAGLAGFNPDPTAFPSDHSGAASVRWGWGPDARPPVLVGAEIDRILATGRPVGRPIPWVLAARSTPAATALALALSEAWPSGSVMLTEVAVPGPPPESVARLLDAAELRIWHHDEPALDGIALAESVLHGCVPLQVMATDALVEARRALPRSAHALLIDAADIGRGPQALEDLEQIWNAAVELLATASSRIGVPA